MKKLLVILVLIPMWSMAEEVPKHMVMISTNGLGASVAVERMNTSSGSKFSKVEKIPENLSLNYAYRITKKQQVGMSFQSIHNELKFEKRGGGSTSSKDKITSVGIFGIHNFDERIQGATYIAGLISYTNIEDEVSHDFSDSEGKAPIEHDDTIMSYEISLGKRFSLEDYNLKNLLYSPSVAVFYNVHAKDFDDQKVTEGWGVGVNVLKFDLLF